MSQLILTIKDDSQLEALITFLKSISYVGNIERVSKDKTIDIPIHHKKILDERLKLHEQNPSDGMNWEEFKAKLDS